MKMQILYMVLATLVAISEANNNKNFCNVPTCLNESHTLCKYTDENPADACGRVVRSSLTQKERVDILNLHNTLRKQVHEGNELRGPAGRQPAAKKYERLVWDEDLEKSAQRWAIQCINTKDKCRDMHEYSVGQNVKLVEGDDDPEAIAFPVMDWYNQVIRFHNGIVERYSPMLGLWNYVAEYTQIVWGKTRRLGCSATRFYDKKANLLFVCNYGPKGNVENEPVYET